MWLTLVETRPVEGLLLSPVVAPEKAERTCGDVELTALLLVALALLTLYTDDLLVFKLMAVRGEIQ